jgi:hypothetical protein
MYLAWVDAVNVAPLPIAMNISPWAGSCDCFLFALSSPRPAIHRTLASLPVQCKQLKDVDGSVQALIPLLSTMVDISHAHAEVAIYSSPSIFIHVVSSLDVSVAGVMLACGRVFLFVQ